MATSMTHASVVSDLTNHDNDEMCVDVTCGIEGETTLPSNAHMPVGVDMDAHSEFDSKPPARVLCNSPTRQVSSDNGEYGNDECECDEDDDDDDIQGDFDMPSAATTDDNDEIPDANNSDANNEADKCDKAWDFREEDLYKGFNVHNAPSRAPPPRKREKPLTFYGGIYVKLDEHFEKVIKVGLASSLRARADRYCERDPTFDASRIHVLLSFDSLARGEYRDIERVYKSFEKFLLEVALGQHPSLKLDKFQASWFKHMFTSGGDCLGGKRAYMLQLLECACQKLYGLGQPMEMAMHDPSVMERQYEIISDESEYILQYLGRIVDLSKERPEDLYICLVRSWMPGRNGISSTVEAGRCILGVRFGNNSWDTIAFAVFPDAKTSEEIFSTAYTEEEKAGGREVLEKSVDMFAEKPFGIMMLDENKLIIAIEPYLISKGFFPVARIRSDEIVVFLNVQGTHAILVHKPLSIAGDSRRFISMELRIARALTMGSLTNVRRLVLGENKLSAKDEFSNPINACNALQLAVVGMHIGLMRGVCWFKLYVSDGNTNRNPLKQNKISKLSSSNAPVTNAEYKRIKREKDPNISRTGGDGRVLEKARMNLAKTLEEFLLLGKDLDDSDVEVLYWVIEWIFSIDKGEEENTDDRWGASLREGTGRSSRKGAKKPDEATKKVARALIAFRQESVTKNAGNRIVGPGKCKTKDEHKDIAGAFEDLMDTHCPDKPSGKGPPFWIQEELDQSVSPPPPPTLPQKGRMSEFGDLEFPAGHKIFLKHVFAGLQNKFKKQHVGLLLNRVKSKLGDKRKAILVREPGSKQAWILVRIVRK